MKFICTIQARYNSTRFPGKILKKLYNHKTVLQCMIERVKQSKFVDDIYILTTQNNADQIIVDHCKELGVKYFQGSENDIINRMLSCVIENNCYYDTLIDLTSDCPLICPRMIDCMCLNYIQLHFDYYSNIVTRSFPDGFDIQIYKAKLLNEIDRIVYNKNHREHSGWNILNYSGVLQTRCHVKIGNYAANDFHPEWGLTLDEPKDFEVIKKIFEYFKHGMFYYPDIIGYIKKSNLLELNKDVERKIPGMA